MTEQTPTEQVDQHVRFERRGKLGLVVLDRPRAINSLTLPMVEAMLEQLTQWQDDDEVAIVAITGAGEKGLCAGGDVVSVRRGLLGTQGTQVAGLVYGTGQGVGLMPGHLLGQVGRVAEADEDGGIRLHRGPPEPFRKDIPEQRGQAGWPHRSHEPLRPA